MKKLLKRGFYILPLILPLKSISQQIYIGQNANEVSQIVSTEYQSNQNARGYNQVSMQYEPHYNNGVLDEIITCKQNVPMIDLHRTADFCTHYVITNNRLQYILIEYSNVSLQALEGVMDSNMKKVGDYYFGITGNYVYFKLMKTGEVDKVYASQALNPPPANILRELRGSKKSITAESLINRKLLITKYTTTKLISVDADDEQSKKSVSYKMEFHDPKLNQDDTTNADGTASIGQLIIKNGSDGKVFKDLITEYKHRTVEKIGITYRYYIMNFKNEHDDNVLEVSKWNKPLIVDGKSYQYSFTLFKLLADGSNEGQRVFLSNRVF